MGKGGSQTVGYKYLVGMHLVDCHGPIDSYSRVEIDQRVVWEGEATGGSITIDAPTIFGGEGREGGVSGTADILMGEPDQLQNDYLVSKVSSQVPAYRGVSGWVLRQMYLGNNPYLKAWKSRGTRIFKAQDGEMQWYPEKAAIANVDIVGSPTLVNIQGGNPPPPGQRGITDMITYNHGYVINTSPNSVLRIRPSGDGTFLAVDPDGDGWRWPLDYVKDDNAATFGRLCATGNPQALTPEAALAAVQAHLGTGGYFTLTGASKYRLWVDLEDNESPLTAEDGGLSFTVEIVSPAGYDMNPAHIIRECLTNNDWGMGYTSDDIGDSFVTAADTLYDEALGISILWDKETKLEDFINEVVRHIDAALYVSRTTGKFELDLIRDDYDIEDLIVLDPSNVFKVTNPSRSSPEELVNSVSVDFWNIRTGADDSVTISDPASVQGQAGQIIGTTIQYPGFTNTRNATIACQRDLRALSASFLSCTIYADRTAKDLTPGAAFRFVWPKWHVDTVMRVVGIAFGDGRSNQVRIVCTEDVFASSTVLTIEDPGTTDGWVDPSQPPTAGSAEAKVFEAPYYELTQSFGQTNVDTTLTTNPEVGYVMAASPRPANAFTAQLWVDSGAGYSKVGIFDFCAKAVLSAAIGKTDTTISFEDGEDLDYIELGDYFLLEDEICRIDAIDELAGTMDIGRGCLDTVPAEHGADVVMLFVDNYNGYDPTEYVSGETLDVKILPASGAGVLSIDDASAIAVELNQRAYRPYAPGDFRVQGESYGLGPYNGELTITFKDRDRTTQTGGTIYDHTFGDIGPEPGVEYRLRFYMNDVLVHTEEPATSGFLYTFEDEGTASVEVDSVRDGVYSWQAANHTFLYSLTDFLSEESSDEFLLIGEEGEYILDEG